MSPTATAIRCGKRVYKTEDEAIHAAIKTSFKWGKPMRHYYCEQCRCWHITSQIRDLAVFG